MRHNEVHSRHRYLRATATLLLLATAIIAAKAGPCTAAPTVALNDSSVTFTWDAAGPSATLQSIDRTATPLLLAQRERVAASALYSRAIDGWWQTQFRAGALDILLLSEEPSLGARRPLAAVVWTAGDPVVRVARWPATEGFEPDSLERLYAMLLRIPMGVPVQFQQDCDERMLAANEKAQPVSLLLRQIAIARAAMDAQGPGDRGLRWRVVDIIPRLDGDQPLSVAARVSGSIGPLAGVSVSFTRAPHLACWAVTDAAGTASCQLYDEHGHSHPNEAGSSLPPTVVSFAGQQVGHEVHVPLHAMFDTPMPTHCLSEVVASDTAAAWGADCRGFAPKSWVWPTPSPR